MKGNKTMQDQKLETYWSRFQGTYDKNQEYVVGKILLDTVEENIQTLPELGDVLELGCGTGYFTAAIAQKAQNVWATDFSNELLKEANKRLSGIEKITIQKEKCTKTSFPAKKFDTVFMANLIHIVENPLATLQESHRLLKDDGLLIITTFTNYGMKPFDILKMGFRFMKVWGKPPEHTHRFTPESLAFLMESAGFSIETANLLGEKTKTLYLIARKTNVQ